MFWRIWKKNVTSNWQRSSQFFKLSAVATLHESTTTRECNSWVPSALSRGTAWATLNFATGSGGDSSPRSSLFWTWQGQMRLCARHWIWRRLMKRSLKRQNRLLWRWRRTSARLQRKSPFCKSNLIVNGTLSRRLMTCVRDCRPGSKNWRSYWMIRWSDSMKKKRRL